MLLKIWFSFYICLFISFFLPSFVCLFTCMHIFMFQGTWVEAREWFANASFFLSCEFLRLNSSHWTWHQTSLPAEPHCQSSTSDFLLNCTSLKPSSENYLLPKESDKCPPGSTYWGWFVRSSCMWVLLSPSYTHHWIADLLDPIKDSGNDGSRLSFSGCDLNSLYFFPDLGILTSIHQHCPVLSVITPPTTQWVSSLSF